MIPRVVQLLFNRRDRAIIVVQIDDDLQDPYGVLDHALRGPTGEQDAGTFGADDAGNEMRGEDAESDVTAMHVDGDDVCGLVKVKGELEYEYEGGEEVGFADAGEIGAVYRVKKGDAWGISLHFFEVEGELEI